MNATIVTHGDVDGMTCAAQILRIEGLECELIYSNAQQIAHNLASIAKRNQRPPRLYITDIPADPDAAKAVEAMQASGVDMHWVDHHPWPEGLHERLANAGTHIIYQEGLRYPAGVLLGQWLEGLDPYCARIAHICYSADKGTEWERDWFRLLSSQTGCCDRSVLERLAMDQPFTEEDRAFIAAQIACELAAKLILAKPPHIVMTATGHSAAVYHTSATPRVYLGSEVFRCHPVDLCINRISARKWQLSVRRVTNLSLRPLSGHHTVNGLTVSIAGRDTLMSVTADGKIPADVHDQVVALLAMLL